MNFRKLCGALTLLLLVAPLGASICGDCAPERCMLTGASGMSASSELPAMAGHPAEPVHQAESRAKSHCDEAEAPAPDPPACHETASSLAAIDCCSVSTAPEPEPAAALTSSVAFEVALEPALETALLATEGDRSVDRRWQPPRQTVRPLYTLHSSLLI